ncbi:biopolymer transport ExbD protein [Nitrospirillum viridazoti Y2]|uniref:Outer membrane transport energization protein ExbD n=1 Tax=Nitrospirillum amazonense TaxID=28077 RepID=A0A560IYW6_9PROT|nr:MULTISPECIES: biopolymer transporter ExbD [Nitrospirillum]EGY02112.1 biopolymer transport ExbD protein [Nitrospirillum amazonense Y2]MEA1677094.1 biopolymer transporter ExbD [Nitrospirillum sp. BR 11163]TWB62164.1 outer membrane transport energization protein ExbD [Nitrospirillum amazonense]TWB73205.1 outer membrane transport energization protein ExbD [Nitrospirillum amazonense]
MGMNVGSAGDGDDDGEVVSAINTTPLVDIMLVLLIIFLITVPVVTHTVNVDLPKERNQPTKTKPENIVIAVNRDGDIFWNESKVPDYSALLEKLKVRAVEQPQPEVHIRGDKNARYEYVGRVVVAAQRAGIVKIGFITEPPAGAIPVAH